MLGRAFGALLSDQFSWRLALLEQLRAAPGKFAELARAESQDPGSAVKGGDLGWVSPGDMVPEFDRMIGKTAIKAISEPFQSSYGWHILRVEGERKQDMRGLASPGDALAFTFA